MFEYIMSGLNMTRIVTKNFRTHPEAIAAVNAAVADANAEGKYMVGALFNAYQEVGLSNVVQSTYRPFFSSVFGDSGGLQVITVGKQITPELKKKIYTLQAENSDVAMCFDEIPLKVMQSAGNASNRTSIDNKAFVVADMEDCARRTGQNINEQLRTFRELNSPAKVMMIVQGNNRFDFARWAELAYGEVEDELKDGVYGIALADTCCGTGMLETVEMCASVPLMKIPDRIKKNIHFLGVGSIVRLAPVIELVKSGLFADCRISFDSTTHTCCVDLGLYVNKKGVRHTMGKNANETNIAWFTDLYHEISKYYKHNVSLQDYLKNTVTRLGNSTHLGDFSDVEQGILANLTFWFSAFTGVRRFMDCLLRCTEDSSHYYEVLTTKASRSILPLLSLSNVKTSEDFESWFATHSRYVHSARIKRFDEAAQKNLITLDLLGVA